MNKTTLLSILVILGMAQLTAGISDESTRILQVRDAIIDTPAANWTAGPTSVSGWTPAKRRCLSMPDPIPKPDREIVSAPPILMAATRFDWRDEGVITPVKHQGSCGSCWAFPPVAAVESKILIDGGTMLDLSEQHLVSACCGAGSCSGGYPSAALRYIKDSGIPDEACSPYVARNTECDPCTGWEKRAWKIGDYVYINSSMSDFKWGLQEYGPMTVVVKVPDDWYYYTSGVYTPVTNVGWANHAVLLVGWDDSDGCWIVKNSWGTGWGEDGYGRVKYGDLERYNYAYAVDVVIDPGASPDIGKWVKPVLAAASSEYSGTHAASKAVDNKTSTHWFSDRNEVDPSITFDMGELMTISKVRAMIYPSDVPMVVNIDVSSDGESWRTVAEDFKILTGSVYVEIPFATIRCQHIQMTQTEAARIYGTCTEFDAWECEAEPEYNMSITIHYDARPDMIIPIDDVGLLGMMLSRGNDSFWEWWNR